MHLDAREQVGLRTTRSYRVAKGEGKAEPAIRSDKSLQKIVHVWASSWVKHLLVVKGAFNTSFKPSLLRRPALISS